jgi:hypothetical protein
MKNKCLVLCLLTPLLFGGCHKSTVINGVSYNGRIINSICGQTTVQITDSTTLGQSNWVDYGTTYNHVFRVENPCNWNPDGIAYSSSIRFVIVAYTVQNCVLCLAAGHTPDIAYSIQLVK